MPRRLRKESEGRAATTAALRPLRPAKLRCNLITARLTKLVVYIKANGLLRVFAVAAPEESERLDRPKLKIYLPGGEALMAPRQEGGEAEGGYCGVLSFVDGCFSSGLLCGATKESGCCLL